MTSKGNAAEGIKKFAGVVQSSGILKKHEELQKVIFGPLKICREKWDTLETEEAVTVLAKIDPRYQAQLILNVEEIFNEEVEKCKSIVEQIDCSLSELQTTFDTINQRLEEEYRKDAELKSSPVVLTCYEDCRSILTFLKLKTSILRTHIAIPLHEKRDANPFAHVPKFADEEENFNYLLSKLLAANF